MNNREAWTLYARYLGAWNAASGEERRSIAAAVLHEHVEYRTPVHELGVGHAPVLADIAAFHERFPGGRFEIGDVSSHHDVAVLSWVIIQADGTEFARGIDQIQADRDGRISRITTFAPSARHPD